MALEKKKYTYPYRSVACDMNFYEQVVKIAKLNKLKRIQVVNILLDFSLTALREQGIGVLHSQFYKNLGEKNGNPTD
jgi:hypothetical protein